MTEDRKEEHLCRVALCGRYATKVQEATALERRRLLVQLRVALWRFRWTLRIVSFVSLGADAREAGPVGHVEVLAAKA